jgi:hypothetical protein
VDEFAKTGCTGHLVRCGEGMSRDEFDRALFRLEDNGQIELSAITRGWRYSEEEFNAGIPQRAGSRLFFVSLK